MGVNRQGCCGRPRSSHDHKVLERSIADPNAVSFMWLRDVATIPGSSHQGAMERLISTLCAAG